MNSGDLYRSFRADVADIARPYLWTDSDVYRYMNGAYRQFVKATGGIADVTSDDTYVKVTAGEPYAEISPRIMRVRQAYLESNGRELEILNQEDIGTSFRTDYNNTGIVLQNMTPGPVRAMVIGLQRNQNAGVVRWVQVPVEDDVVRLSIYRMPLRMIEEGDEEFTFSEIGEDHVEYLLLWMKAMAYGKQDSETYDRDKREANIAEFNAYCRSARAEWEKYKHKTRVVAYGGY